MDDEDQECGRSGVWQAFKRLSLASSPQTLIRETSVSLVKTGKIAGLGRTAILTVV